MPKYPTNGMNRRELDTIILALGGTIEYPRRTGDALYRHPAVAHPVRVNNRRKDSTRALVALARAAYDAVHHDDPHQEADGGERPDGSPLETRACCEEFEKVVNTGQVTS